MATSWRTGAEIGPRPSHVRPFDPKANYPRVIDPDAEWQFPQNRCVYFRLRIWQ